MDPEKISVIIPTYNRALLLGQCLASVRAQGDPNVEILVVDDGSTDGTGAGLAEVTDVRYFMQPNQGPSVARNLGLDKATGALVLFLDSDDLLEPGFLKESRRLLADPDVGMVIHNCRLVGRNLEILKPSYFDARGWRFGVGSECHTQSALDMRQFLLRHSITGSGVVMRRGLIRFPWKSYVRVGEDRVFLLENLLASDYKTAVSTRPLWSWRVHSNNAYQAQPLTDLMAFLDNRSLACIRQLLPDISPQEKRDIDRAQAANYFDWAYHSFLGGHFGRASVLYRASWNLSPTYRTAKARMINSLMAATERRPVLQWLVGRPLRALIQWRHRPRRPERLNSDTDYH